MERNLHNVTLQRQKCFTDTSLHHQRWVPFHYNKETNWYKLWQTQYLINLYTFIYMYPFRSVISQSSSICPPYYARVGCTNMFPYASICFLHTSYTGYRISAQRYVGIWFELCNNFKSLLHYFVLFDMHLNQQFIRKVASSLGPSTQTLVHDFFNRLKRVPQCRCHNGQLLCTQTRLLLTCQISRHSDIEGVDALLWFRLNNDAITGEAGPGAWDCHHHEFIPCVWT